MKQVQLIKDFAPRSYQQSIFANSMDKNALVVLPTGLGKTVIALMLATYYFNSNNKKILFLAPTKPLVEQQKVSFENFYENSQDFNFQVLTGLVSPKKRALLYKEQDFIFSTPQLIENDIINRVLDPKDFGLVIIDEAHRGTGNYAYGFIAQEFDKAYTKILALTASPGTNISQIREVMTNLCINHIEVKRYEDEDVKPYVNKTNIKHIEIELGKELVEIKDLLQKVYNSKLEELKQLDIGITKPLVSKKDLLDIQIALRSKISSGEADENVWAAISIAAALMKLSYGQELFESQEIAAAYIYFHNFFRSGGDKSKAAEALTYDIDFRDAYGKIKTLKEKNILHPKLEKLKEIITLEIHKNKDLKIIVFNQYRESAQKIVEELSKIEDINPVLFVGQAKKGEFKLSQKEQKEVIQNFRDAKHNVLVSTSVGEEGLDIPKVDLVIFYEPVPSAIRTIQRVGRTGRFNEGNAYILQSLGTRDMITRHVANAKEKSMYKALEKLVSDFNKLENKKVEKGLGDYINKKNIIESKQPINEKESELSKQLNPKIPIYVDQRENTDLIKEIYSIDELEVHSKQLDVGDIVITENIAIERKAKIDFVNSIIDKRLFPQLMDLARNFRRPILILEGEENIYTLRNLNPNVIRATLSAIAVDLRIPIIVTNNMQETAQMIRTIAKRTKKDKKEISLVSDKKSHSENEEMEKFVSSIPKINVVNAKGLLSHFKSLKDLINASEKELLEVQGIGPGRAKFLREFFEREYQL
ncbi:MAG: helicase-related protein [Nanoarchaeota archaeon]|nr:helicase-related protein [Nanoarchaeota archaeon]